MIVVNSTLKTDVAHRSPSITAMYNELKSSNTHRVLDLGSFSASSFTFFRQLSCKIHFENLDEFLAETQQQPLSSTAMIEALDGYLTNFEQSEQFDVVLTWDLFNYLDLATVTWLVERIKRFCRPNALLHTVKCVSAEIPVAPRQFHIIDQYQLRIKQQYPSAPRLQPCHDTATLLRSMPNFHMENSYLNYADMIPGLAEQLLRYQPGKVLTQRRQSSDELTKSIDIKISQSSRPGVNHRSYAIPEILDSLAVKTEINVLDLGIRNRNNYDFLYSLTDGVFAEDIFQEFAVQLKSGGEQKVKSHMLNFADDLRFDAIFIWDLLHFLPAELIKIVFQKLLPYTHKQTLLHAIVYSGKEMPQQPQQFQFTNRENISVFPSPTHTTQKALTSTQLLKTLSHFNLSGSFVFRPGMQRGLYEYIFRRRECL